MKDSPANSALTAGKVPGYQNDRNVKFLLQLIKQEEARRHKEAIAKGFNIKVNVRLENSSPPIIEIPDINLRCQL